MPDTTLNAFRNQISELARPNRFAITFTNYTPELIAALGSFEEPQGSPLNSVYVVKSTSVPGRVVGDIANLWWQGMNYKLPGDPMYDDYNIMFMNNYTVRKFIEKWLNLIANPVTNIRSSHQQYKVTMQADILSPRDGIVVRRYFLHGAYPKSIDPIDLAMDMNDTIEEFGSTWGFDYFSNNSDPAAVGATVKGTGLTPVQ